jgi:hypothetical protein
MSRTPLFTAGLDPNAGTSWFWSVYPTLGSYASAKTG